MRNIRRIAAAFCICGIFFAAGCAHMLQQGSPKDQLTAAVQKWWQAKKSGDNETLYVMMSSENRAKITKSDFYKQQKNVYPRAYEIKNAVIDESGKSAVVAVEYAILVRAVDFKFTSNEIWILEEGQWRFSSLKASEGKQKTFPRK